ncbi:MAG TPA: heat-inducible transcriptional repressor HrcA [Gemmatimonadaceae bacterium]|nr:heat-inducible transcriptional repressor HrcA [Gemmatimonadaceae bacterium]
MANSDLTERERRVLEAVIQSFVESAEPAGSRHISRRFGLGVSAATIRNTMSDLEHKGYLFHPHTSAGRVPSDKAYRAYVDGLMRVRPLPSGAQAKLEEKLRTSGGTIETILLRAAETLGVLTQELGIALGPSLDQTVLERLDLVRVSSDRIVLVMTLRGGAVRTVFVEVRGEIAESVLAEVAMVLNERLSGLTIAKIKGSMSSRLRDAARTPQAHEMLNIFVEEGEQLFDAALSQDAGVMLGQASVLAEQPEFASGEGMRRLMQLTETRQRLAAALRNRSTGPGITITIGSEHGDPMLGKFTVVTAEYRTDALSGVIGVIGPTRMPYEKVVSVVTHASRLVTALLD